MSTAQVVVDAIQPGLQLGAEAREAGVLPPLETSVVAYLHLVELGQCVVRGSAGDAQSKRSRSVRTR
jgi:hypothetical protein